MSTAVERPARRPWLHGRIGRVRYIACVLGLALSCALFFSLTAAWLISTATPYSGVPVLNALRIVLFMLVLPAGLLYWTVLRAHDMGRRGWVALLVFVPVVNLLFWVWPGHKHENRFGPCPTPAPRWMQVLVAVAVGILLGLYGLAWLHGPWRTAPPAPPSPLHHDPQ
jgi:uncharacterized membrane protein YhaH (DUF805 family)